MEMQSPQAITCQICKRTFKILEALPAALVRPAVVAIIRTVHPSWDPEGYICYGDLHHFRGEHLRRLLEQERGELSALDEEVVRTIREHNLVTTAESLSLERHLTLGERMADRVSSFGGSWKFIMMFGAFIVIWVGVNGVGYFGARWDHYPFILLNLVLSCLAAIQAPVIMMSQNRLEAKDRLRAEYDYKVNLKTELEVRVLNEKIDRLLFHQWQRLLEIQEIQTDFMEELTERRRERGE
jgi:uncharacterized membrane protein